MPKLKRWYNVTKFCEEIEKRLDRRKARSLVLFHAFKLGYIEVQEESAWSVTYRFKNDFFPTIHHVHEVVKAI
jgi:hypothetical protein